jgi:tetratricopeptide (TPR) repeat protein
VAVLGVVSVRFAADAALVSASLVAASLSALLRAPLGAAGTPALARLHRARGFASGTAIALLLLAVAAPRLAEARANRPALDVSVDVTALPLQALRFADDNGLRDHMYNDFEIGSYLLFEGYPRHRVFVDPRLPAYPEELHRELGRFDHDRASWHALMTRYRVDSALLAYGGVNRRAAWWDPRHWALVYRAGDARVFARRRPERRAFIAAHEIPLTFDFTVDTGATPRPLLERPPESPVSDCEWQRRVGDVLFELDGGRVSRARPHYERALAIPGCLAAADEAALAGWVGAIDLGARDWPAALARLDRALVLAPEDVRTRANRATALERLGRRRTAAEYWAHIAASAAGTKVGDAAAARARELGR